MKRTDPRGQRVLDWASVLTAALCAARPAFANSPALGVFTAVASALFAFFAAPAGPSGALARVALLLSGSIVGWSSPASLGLAEPWHAFFARDAGQSPLLVLRGGLLLALVLATEAQSKRTRFCLLTLAGTALVLSLSFRVVLLPFAALALVLLGWSARTAPVTPPLGHRLLSVGALVTALLSLLGPPVPRPGEREPSAPVDAVAWWLQRENPYQAHYRASGWARGEAVPGEGYLALAKLDLTLGRRDAARRVLAKLVAHASADDVRERASRLQAKLDAAPSDPTQSVSEPTPSGPTGQQ